MGTLLFPRPSVRNNRTPALEATRAAESAAGASVLTMDTVVGQLVAARIEAGQELLRDESFVDCPSALTNGRWHTHPVRAEPALVPVEQLRDLDCSHAHVQRHRVRTGVMHLHLVARAGIARLTASALCRPVCRIRVFLSVSCIIQIRIHSVGSVSLCVSCRARGPYEIVNLRGT